jgi:hypothetical protein
MPRSRKGGLAAALLLFALPLFAAQPYHLTLEASPGAPFPFLGKFGTITIDVYPGGVRAETLLLNGFSRNGASTITVENPFTRMYTKEPVAGIASALQTLGRVDVETSSVPARGPEIAGKVGNVNATRYRLIYGPQGWIDVWTTAAIPPNPQFRTLIDAFVRGIAPGAAVAMRTIPGTPLYVELNFRRFRKLPLLRLKSLVMNSDGEERALDVGRLYFPAP